MLARACGKTSVHNLEPEDLAALTVEASAMARVPLAGTDYIPGVSEERALDEIRTHARPVPREPGRLPADARGVPRRRIRSDRGRTTCASPRRSTRSTPSTSPGKRFPYQEDISLVEDIDLEAATPGKDLNWLEDVELLEEEGTPAVFDRYSNSFLQDLLPDPARAERTRSRARS